ncbi:MAG: DUF63 family protein, partial [Methanomicrobiales archaeon]|nr:DUF63 family protein [Methanomicrobiales archaeon]
DFIYRYYIDPIRYGEAYTLVDTLTYACILIVSVYIVYRSLKRAGISIDEKLVVSTLPFVLFGGLLRVVEDTGIITSDLRFLLVTPLIFFVVFLLTISALLFSTTLERKGVIRNYSVLYGSLGMAAAILCGGVLVYVGVTSATLGITELAIILGLAGSTSLALWLGLHYIAGWRFVSYSLYKFLIFGHMLDASATSYGIDLHAIPYTEVHVVGSTLITLTGTAFSMFLLKLAVIIPAVYILEQYKKEGNRELWFIIVLCMIVLGLAPGIRDLARMVLYV